jgi:predicted GNAT family acetyltransferase
MSVPQAAPLIATNVLKLSVELFESEAEYFSLGGQRKPLHAAELVWVPGFESAPPGCVVQRVRPRRIAVAPAKWIQEVEREVRSTDASWVRVFLSEPAPELEKALLKAKYRRRLEIGFLSLNGAPDRELATSWRPCMTETDWKAKFLLHAENGNGADGYKVDARQWTDLMRRKVETGRKEPFLLERDGQVCGEVAVIEMGDLLRLKNLHVSHRWRGKGVGRDAVHLVWQEARRRARQVVGMFGMEGSGTELCHKAGLLPQMQQVEWSKKL